jgi:hypothetical protein
MLRRTVQQLSVFSHNLGGDGFKVIVLLWLSLVFVMLSHMLIILSYVVMSFHCFMILESISWFCTFNKDGQDLCCSCMSHPLLSIVSKGSCSPGRCVIV